MKSKNDEHKQRTFKIDFLAVCTIVILFFVSISSFKLDHRGFLSLAFAIALLTVFSIVMEKTPEDIIKTLRQVDAPSALLMSVLLGVAFVGFWLSIRKTGLLVYNYLFVESYRYAPYEIFDIVAFILAARLCFTLFDTIRKVAAEPSKLKGFFDTVIQAVIIAIIILLPNYGNEGLLARIGGSFGFLLLLIGMTMLLVSLVFVSEYSRNSKK